MSLRKRRTLSSVGLLLGWHLAFRPVGRLMFRIGRWYLFAGIVRYFIDVRVWMIGVDHGLIPRQRIFGLAYRQYRDCQYDPQGERCRPGWTPVKSAFLVHALVLVALLTPNFSRVGKVLPVIRLFHRLPALSPGILGLRPILVGLVLRPLAALLPAFLPVGHVACRAVAPLLAGVAHVVVGVAVAALVLIVSHDGLPLVEHRKVCVQL
ncbi:hypothetical protein DA83_26205 [Pseudomonas sp. 250J]|nr:hypothetical protein DA83_26205 [Pseudomonas sp. 250J]